MATAVIYCTTPYTDEQLKAIYEQLRHYESSSEHSEVGSNIDVPLTQGEGKAEKLRETIFAYIKKYGHDEDFDPTGEGEPLFVATRAPAGSEEKIKVLELRVEKGFPLWHKDDPVDYSGNFGGLRALVHSSDNADPSPDDIALDRSLFPPRPEQQSGNKSRRSQSAVDKRDVDKGVR